MLLPKAVRALIHTRALALAVLIVALTAGTAIAAVITGDNSDNTLIGTSEPDVISDGGGSDTIYGLAGADVILAGNGNDVLDGDGHCEGTGTTAKPYCSHGTIPDDGGDFIGAGNGDDTVFGGGGNNMIILGTGNDTVYGGPDDDQIAVGLGGHGSDHVYLGSGSNIVAVGNGDNRVYAFRPGDKHVDYIFCGSTATVVYANKQDVTRNCTVRHGHAQHTG